MDMEKKIKAVPVKIFVKDNPGKSASGKQRPKYNVKIEFNQSFKTDLSINDIPGGMDAWIEEMMKSGVVKIPAGIKAQAAAWESNRLTVNGDKQADGELELPYNPNAVNVSSEGVVAEPQLAAAQ